MYQCEFASNYKFLFSEGPAFGGLADYIYDEQNTNVTFTYNQSGTQTVQFSVEILRDSFLEGFETFVAAITGGNRVEITIQDTTGNKLNASRKLEH